MSLLNFHRKSPVFSDVSIFLWTWLPLPALQCIFHTAYITGISDIPYLLVYMHRILKLKYQVVFIKFGIADKTDVECNWDGWMDEWTI